MTPQFTSGRAIDTRNADTEDINLNGLIRAQQQINTLHGMRAQEQGKMPNVEVTGNTKAQLLGRPVDCRVGGGKP